MSTAATTASAVYAVELRDLRKSFGKTEIIRGTSLAVKPGERVAIIGPNGAGKSTLFNLISGRFGPTSGEIHLRGERIDGKAPYEIARRGLARSFQVSNLFTRLSVFENVRCAVLYSMGYRYAFWRFLADLKDANERAEQVLRMIKLERRRNHLAMNLTYAEQRALEIGITIAGGADFEVHAVQHVALAIVGVQVGEFQHRVNAPAPTPSPNTPPARAHSRALRPACRTRSPRRTPARRSCRPGRTPPPCRAPP